MKIIDVMKKKEYLLLAVAVAVVFGSFYIYTQVLGIVENIGIWIENIPVTNLILFLVFDILFGISVSFQVYNWRQPKTCNIKKPAGTTSSAMAMGLLVAQCPACASIAALFLPVSAIGFLVTFGPLITLASIALLLFTINYLGGFR